MCKHYKHSYLEASRENLQKMGLRVYSLQGSQISDRYPAIQGDLKTTRGYLNPFCGWADAHGSIQNLARKCVAAGISFLTGPDGTVTSLVKDNGRIVALETSTGARLQTGLVVFATGSWTPYLIDMDRVSISTGQPVGFIQLTSAEAEQLRGTPIVINLSTGWFIFLPIPGTNILKMARHGYGYETSRHSSSLGKIVSAPMLDANNTTSRFIPYDADLALKEGLTSLFPQFKDKSFSNRRLCWYSDTSQGDFILDYHPQYRNLFVATGDSGHAFKFLPVLGHYIADMFEGKATEAQRNRWQWKQSSTAISRGDGRRGGPPRRALNREEQAKL
ncbi:unnamed protein product [Penicillium salamii]|uniref:FAD dependent oxidoreductase domain-containing protein n=1 Tax=Penicillium salamii TaxID=1612424 RepID=A0A9W4JXJ7_9EURO|nr:unnamed protein product [Penicillium salamii]